jgi:hypothetical protein
MAIAKKFHRHTLKQSSSPQINKIYVGSDQQRSTIKKNLNLLVYCYMTPESRNNIVGIRYQATASENIQDLVSALLRNRVR